ncbi:MAG TPA: hypothetical protein VL728_19630 [Cyclobacteriaceae bacterium]|jgi:hypothetical protein|nr:hypothetical protein [Cyclobacteriaceae bacterium]
MFQVLIKNESGQLIEKNTRQFTKASEAVGYMSKLIDWHTEKQDIRTIEMKQDGKSILTEQTNTSSENLK